MIAQAIADGIFTGAIIALGAIGVSFTLQILRFANFSHSELVTWGAYLALVFVGFAGPGTPTGCSGASASRCTAAPPRGSATAGPTRQRPGSSSPDRGEDLSRQGDGQIGPRGRSGARGRFVASG